jgi:hypothetical protein
MAPNRFMPLALLRERILYSQKLRLHEFDSAAFPFLGCDPKTASLTPLEYQCLFRVKLGNTRCEQMFSALPLEADQPPPAERCGVRTETAQPLGFRQT